MEGPEGRNWSGCSHKRDDVRRGRLCIGMGMVRSRRLVVFHFPRRLSFLRPPPPHKWWPPLTMAPWDRAGLLCSLFRWAKGPGDLLHLSKGTRSVMDPGNLLSLTSLRGMAAVNSVMARNETLGNGRKLKELLKENMLFVVFGDVTLVQFSRYLLSLYRSFLLGRVESWAGQRRSMGM